MLVARHYWRLVSPLMITLWTWKAPWECMQVILMSPQILLKLYCICKMSYCRCKVTVVLWEMWWCIGGQESFFFCMENQLQSYNYFIMNLVRSWLCNTEKETEVLPRAHLLLSDEYGGAAQSMSSYLVQSGYDMDIYGDAPDKMTYTEQANKRSHCKRLTR